MRLSLGVVKCALRAKPYKRGGSNSQKEYVSLSNLYGIAEYTAGNVYLRPFDFYKRILSALSRVPRNLG